MSSSLLMKRSISSSFQTWVKSTPRNPFLFTRGTLSYPTQTPLPFLSKPLQISKLALRVYSSKPHPTQNESFCDKIYLPQKIDITPTTTTKHTTLSTTSLSSSSSSNPSIDYIHSSSEEFINTVQITALKGIGVACATGIVLSPIIIITGFVPLLIGIGGMFYTVFRLANLSNQWKTQASQELNDKIEKNYWSLCVFSGSCLAPILMILGNNLWWTLPSAIGITAGLMYGIGRMVQSMNHPNMLEKWQTPLVTGLVGLIAMDLVGLGALMIVGPNVLSSIIHSVDLHVGILLMSGFVAYDTHMAKIAYEKDKNTNVYIHSTEMFLNLINIVQRVLIIMAEWLDKK